MPAAAPLPNRVNPFGALEAVPARGLLFGNRGGLFHDAASRSVPGRPWASCQWIICLCDFKGRAAARRQAGRTVWDGLRFTELFFCDEVTALAAGHRPCTECRREASLAFRRAAASGGAFPAMPSCPDLDARLDAERRDGRLKRLHRRDMATLPDGAMITIGNEAFALRHALLWRWSQTGYGAPRAAPSGMVDCLTPPATLAALSAGYRPLWRPSADGLRPAPVPAPPSSP